MKISKHITYKEVTHSATALRKDLSNIPTNEQILNIKELANNVFEPLREHLSVPIYISSIFRSEEVNNAVGGSKSSQHLANKGAAMDIDDTLGGTTNLEMGDYIRENLEFDQLIYEFLDDSGKVKWIHVSYNLLHNRKQVLIAYRNGKKTEYLPYHKFKYLITL